MNPLVFQLDQWNFVQLVAIKIEPRKIRGMF